MADKKYANKHVVPTFGTSIFSRLCAADTVFTADKKCLLLPSFRRKANLSPPVGLLHLYKIVLSFAFSLMFSSALMCSCWIQNESSQTLLANGVCEEGVLELSRKNLQLTRTCSYNILAFKMPRQLQYFPFHSPLGAVS